MFRWVLIGIGAVCGPACGSVTWTFDADAMGWSTLNDARDFAWDGVLGQPAGAIRARDVGDGRIWYFAAPVVDVSNAASMYGGTIGWDALGIQGNQTSISARADVMLVGAGLEIGLSVSEVPNNTTWTSWAASVSAAAGWETISSLENGELSGVAATEADIRAVLGDLQGLYIRGEFTNGADQSALDNVYFVPAPAGAALLAIGGMGVSRRRR
jgi:hypothetical protein